MFAGKRTFPAVKRGGALNRLSGINCARGGWGADTRAQAWLGHGSTLAPPPSHWLTIKEQTSWSALVVHPHLNSPRLFKRLCSTGGLFALGEKRETEVFMD